MVLHGDEPKRSSTMLKATLYYAIFLSGFKDCNANYEPIDCSSILFSNPILQVAPSL